MRKKHIHNMNEYCLASIIAGGCDSTTEKQHMLPSPNHKDRGDEDFLDYFTASILAYASKQEKEDE
jgi:hypothetical protein